MSSTYDIEKIVSGRLNDLKKAQKRIDLAIYLAIFLHIAVEIKRLVGIHASELKTGIERLPESMQNDAMKALSTSILESEKFIRKYLNQADNMFDKDPMSFEIAMMHVKHHAIDRVARARALELIQEKEAAALKVGRLRMKRTSIPRGAKFRLRVHLSPFRGQSYMAAVTARYRQRKSKSTRSPFQ